MRITDDDDETYLERGKIPVKSPYSNKREDLFLFEWDKDTPKKDLPLSDHALFENPDRVKGSRY